MVNSKTLQDENLNYALSKDVQSKNIEHCNRTKIKREVLRIKNLPLKRHTRFRFPIGSNQGVFFLRLTAVEDYIEGVLCINEEIICLSYDRTPSGPIGGESSRW